MVSVPTSAALTNGVVPEPAISRHTSNPPSVVIAILPEFDVTEVFGR